MNSAGSSERPLPGRSGAISRKRSASCSNHGKKTLPSSPGPGCSRTIGSPAAGLAMVDHTATVARLSLASGRMANFIETGTEIGGYRIEGILGAGGVGAVYEARKLDSERVVALKVLQAAAGADDRTRERFRREASARRRSTTRTWCRSTTRSTWTATCSIAMQIVRGGTLKDLIREGKVGPEAAVQILARRCRRARRCTRGGHGAPRREAAERARVGGRPRVPVGPRPDAADGGGAAHGGGPVRRLDRLHGAGAAEPGPGHLAHRHLLVHGGAVRGAHGARCRTRGRWRPRSSTPTSRRRRRA